MVVTKALKTRIYPSKEQAVQIDITINCCRFVYNSMLNRNNKVYQRRGEHLSYIDMQNLLPKMKIYLPWLKDADSQALKYACRNVDTAYQNFFKKRTRFPRFKRKHDNRQSYTTQHPTSLRYKPQEVSLPKIGIMRCSDTRELPAGAKICNATISKEGDKYYVSIIYKYEKEVMPATVNENQVRGLDYKSDGLYVDDLGNTADMPHWYRLSQKDLAKQQKKLSKKQGSRKGERKSNRWLKQQKCVNKTHKHITNQRKDYLHKESTRLADTYDAICIEDLDMKALSNKGFKNGKATLDNGYGMFTNMLEYKLRERGKQLIKVDRFYASSQTCNCCGFKNPEVKNLKLRKWDCPNCGTHNDRDINAAKNIKSQGLLKLAV